MAACLPAASRSRRPGVPLPLAFLPFLAAFFFVNCALAAASEGKLAFGTASFPTARRPVLARLVGRKSNGNSASSFAGRRRGQMLIDEPSTNAAGVNALASTAAGSFDGNKVTEEVTKPIQRPNGVTPCVVPIMTERNFSLYYDPVTVTYFPPTDPGCTAPWQLVVVNMTARLDGPNFDRRFTFYLGGIPLLVATTPEYASPGVNFTSERDLTLYSRFLIQSQTGVIELPNPTDSTYTGVYTVSLELQFYPGTPAQTLPDVVLPAPKASFTAPRNVYQAKVEIYVSHYQTDEFYYGCIPASYIKTLSQADQQFLAENGDTCNTTAFREVVVSLDGTPVGVVFPQPLLYSGADDPLAWRGFMGIGSLFMPTYTLDVTPFVGRMIDGAAHSLTVEARFASTGSLWIAAGALLLWRDPAQTQTRGQLQFSRITGPNLNEVVSDPGSLNTQIRTTASRQFSASGVVASSFGIITTTVTSALSFSNRLIFGRDLNFNSVDYLSTTTSTVQRSKVGSGILSTEQTTFQFPLEVASDYVVFPGNALTGFTYNVVWRFNHAVVSTQSVTTPTSQQTASLSNTQGISTLMSADYYNIYNYLLSGTHNYNLTSTKGCYARVVQTVIDPSQYSTFFPQVVNEGEATSCPA